MGGLTGSQFLEGGCWERRGDFFHGGEGGFQILVYLSQNNLKSDIINDKKKFIYKNFSAITKNLNCKILTKNLVTFKRRDEIKDEKL